MHPEQGGSVITDTQHKTDVDGSETITGVKDEANPPPGEEEHHAEDNLGGEDPVILQENEEGGPPVPEGGPAEPNLGADGDAPELDNNIQVNMAALVRKPELFSGEEPEQFQEWLTRFGVIAVANGWDEARQLAILPSYLTHHAFQLCEEIDPADRDTLLKLRTALIAKLDTGDRHMLWRLQLRTAKRNAGESQAAYAFRLRKLVTRAYPTMAQADQNNVIKEQFILGQSKEMQYSLLKLADNTTMTTVVDTAKKYDAANEIVHGTKGINLTEARSRDDYDRRELQRSSTCRA